MVFGRLTEMIKIKKEMICKLNRIYYIQVYFCPVLFSPFYTLKLFPHSWICPNMVMFQLKDIEKKISPSLKFAHWQLGRKG